MSIAEHPLYPFLKEAGQAYAEQYAVYHSNDPGFRHEWDKQWDKLWELHRKIKDLAAKVTQPFTEAKFLVNGKYTIKVAKSGNYFYAMDLENFGCGKVIYSSPTIAVRELLYEHSKSLESMEYVP